jgi:putative Mn2+ efflux pump MntP
MQASLVGVGLLLGLDSLCICVAIGMLQPRGALPRGLAFAFGVCDGLSSLAGASLSLAGLGTYLGRAVVLGPLAVALYAVFVLALTQRHRCSAPRASEHVGRVSVLLLPLCLSLDNLVVGFGPAASGPAGVSQAFVVGGLSGLSAMAGLWIGGICRTRIPRRAKYLAGAVLVLFTGLLVGRELFS